MDYEVGSLADLISGTTTANKQKVVEKAFKKFSKVETELPKKVKHAEKQNEPTLKSNVFVDKNKAQFMRVKDAVKKLKQRKQQLNTNKVIDDEVNQVVKVKKNKHKHENGEDLEENNEENDLKVVKVKKNKHKLGNSEQLEENIEENDEIAEVLVKAKKNKKRKHTDNLETNEEENEALEDNAKPVIKVKKNKKQKKISNDDEINTEADETKIESELPEIDSMSDNDSDDDDDEKPKTKKELLHNAVKRIKAKATKEKHAENQDNKPLFTERTIFVGNVPIKVHKVKLTKFFKRFGTVEAVRFRCAPIADPRTPKKVAIIRQEFHPDRNSLNAFIRFSTKEEAQKALSVNGLCYQNHHLRVNMSGETDPRDEKRAIFVGNLSFDAEDNDLWTLFEPCGKIESVRLIRDRRTNIGKGFGYVNFESSDSVELALQMENVMFNKRELRISICSLTSAKTQKKKDKKLKKSQNNDSFNHNRPERKFNDGKKFGHNKPEGKFNDGKKFGFNKPEGKFNDKKFGPKKPVEGKDNENGDSEGIKNKSFNIKDKNFQGSKFTEKKKKKKFDKGAHQKKKMIQKLAPRKTA